jgi:hypothetical protein
MINYFVAAFVNKFAWLENAYQQPISGTTS